MSMMYTCREMVDLVAKELDAPLPRTVRMRMATHLSLCADCRVAKEQLLFVEKLVQEYFAQASEGGSGELSTQGNTQLSTEARKRLEALLH